MCYRPIKIVNRSRFLSSLHNEKYFYYIPCGKCADCQKQKSNEWYFRAFSEFHDCVGSDSNNFVLFDTLTYSPEHLPRFMGYPCFSYTDVKRFFARLRINLERAGYDVGNNLRYFLTSEYGTHPRDGITYRPHYHVLFYCSVPNLRPVDLSYFISDAWCLGLTDGAKYKGVYYVNKKRVFKKRLSDSIFVCKYVSKYVQKSSAYSALFEQRKMECLNKVLSSKFSQFVPFKKGDYRLYYMFYNYDDSSAANWLRSAEGRKFVNKLNRLFGQFHLQSLGFGLGALSNVDLLELFDTGSLFIPDNKTVVMRVSLPTYYKRKLFYQQVVVDGVKYWCPTDFGKQYLKYRQTKLFEHVKMQYQDIIRHHCLNFDSSNIAHYVCFKRGRLKGLLSEDVWIDDKLDKLPNLLYNYVTPADYRHFKLYFVSNVYHGGLKNYSDSAVSCIPLSKFIEDNVFFDSVLESQLAIIDNILYNDGLHRECAAAISERVRNIHRSI